MTKRAVIALLVTLLAPAASANAQSSTNGGSFFVIAGGVPGETPISSTAISATASGELIITFHGDSASGCQAIGVCAYNGTVIIRPGSAYVFVAKYRRDRHIAYEGSLNLGFGTPSAQAITFARVERQESGQVQGVCSDVDQPTTAVQLTIGKGAVTAAMLQPGGALLATRCAGPLDSDLAGAGPSISVPLPRLLKGRTPLLLSGNWTFAAHGFAGTVTSTIVLRLSQPQTATASSSTNSFPPGITTERMRIVTEQLSLVRGTGSVTALIKGTTDATECSLLDSCGVSGSLALKPNFTGLAGALSATGPASLPYRDFLAALGLSHQGSPSDIQVQGSVMWNDEGTVTSSLTQAGFSCLGSAPLGPGYVGLAPHGKQLDAVYMPTTPARTQCPGPMLSQDDPLSEGSVSVSALARQTLTVNLTRGQSFSNDGYRGQTNGHLTLTLHRGHITQQIVTQPNE